MRLGKQSPSASDSSIKPAKDALTRREFARRAALGTVAVASGPSAAWRALRADAWCASAARQSPAGDEKLSAQSLAEAESRYQAILAQYPDRFSDAQKIDLKHVCLVTQQSLDGLRAYTVGNADQPALYLKPVVERQKKTNAAPNLKAAAPAAGHAATAGTMAVSPAKAPSKPASAAPLPTTPEKP